MIRAFGPTEIIFMLEAARWTVLLSVVAYLGGGALGLVLATLRVSAWRPARLLAAGWIALFQSIPLLMLLFLVFFGLALVGRDQNPYVAVTLALSAYAGAYFGEIWRGAVQAVPPGQWEAGRALGLRYLSIFRLIILPQALRIAIPPTVGFMVQVVKNTSVTALIGFVELTRAGQLLNTMTFQPFHVFLSVAAMYFIVCYSLAVLFARIEKRVRRASR